MKRIFLSTLLALGASATAQAVISDRPSLINAPVHGVYAPMGFDDNDNAQLVVTGAYPNSCYKVGHTSAEVDHASKTIQVKITAYYYPADFCLQLYIPYQESISLGVLESGSYRILVNGKEDPTAATLPVAQAHNVGPDDYLYAPVSNAEINDLKEINVKGVFSDSCMALKELRVIKESDKVVTVLPIASMIEGCVSQPAETRWNSVARLPSGLKGNVLVQIRSLNGQSLNVVHTFR